MSDTITVEAFNEDVEVEVRHLNEFEIAQALVCEATLLSRTQIGLLPADAIAEIFEAVVKRTEMGAQEE